MSWGITWNWTESLPLGGEGIGGKKNNTFSLGIFSQIICSLQSNPFGSKISYSTWWVTWYLSSCHLAREVTQRLPRDQVPFVLMMTARYIQVNGRGGRTGDCSATFERWETAKSVRLTTFAASHFLMHYFPS